MPHVFHLPTATIVDLVGEDAAAILHNLTTNDVKSLEIGCGCETFLTDVRGKMLAHVFAFRTANGFRMIGAAGQSEAISNHADRYTIREDAKPVDQSASLTCYVLGPEASVTLRDETDWASQGIAVYDVDWLGADTLVLVGEDPNGAPQIVETVGESIGDESAFHTARTIAGFPWYGIDLSEKNLPQEATRIEQTICFTKGCYLGQETVARLDALGQVQKQLVRWQTSGVIPQPGSEVKLNDKVVGRLTSVAQMGEDTATAIGIARRSHFEPGSKASGDGFEAVVV